MSQEHILSYVPFGEEELPVTLQVGLRGANGDWLIASDRRDSPIPALRRAGEV